MLARLELGQDDRIRRAAGRQSDLIAPNQTSFFVFFAPLRLCVIGPPSVRNRKIKRQGAKAQRRKERQRLRLQSESVAPNQSKSNHSTVFLAPQRLWASAL